MKHPRRPRPIRPDAILSAPDATPGQQAHLDQVVEGYLSGDERGPVLFVLTGYGVVDPSTGRVTGLDVKLQADTRLPRDRASWAMRRVADQIDGER